MEQPTPNSFEDQPSWFVRLVFSPTLWGGLLTVAFYSLIPMLPVQREFMQRYFCSHPLEYVTTTLFIVGVTILLFKAFGLSAERSIWKLDWVKNLTLWQRQTPAATAADLETHLADLEPILQETLFAQRLRDACVFVKGKQASRGLEDHLKYLAEFAAERLHSSFALVRTITWAVPILGFLGTVMGITMAIANVTPDQLETSIGDVTSGLAVAFDTTALALGLSLVLVFVTFLVERAEQKILERIEEYGLKQVLGIFQSEEAASPLQLAERAAGEKLLAETDSLIHHHSEQWQQSLELLRRKWVGTLQDQQEGLQQTLSAGMQQSLLDHSEQLELSRNDFLSAVNHVGQNLRQLTEQSTVQQREQAQQSQEVFRDFLNSLQSWESSLAGNQQAIHQQTGILQELLSQEDLLTRLQSNLATNLELLQHNITFEETLQSLTATVQLLAAKSRPKAA